VRLSDTLLARVAAVLDPRPEILDAYVFGSHGRGAAQPHSDVDVAVYVGDRPSAGSPYGYVADLTSVLMGALGTSALDVVVLNAAPPLLYHRVLRDGVRVLSRDLRATTTREGRALSRYCDYVPQLAKIEAAHRARTTGDRFGLMSPGASDAAVVRRHLLALDAAVQHLRRHAGRPVASLASDPDERWAVERGLHLAAQNALDVATHLAASAGRDVPDYATAIDTLGELGILPREFAARFRGLAGFRNVLVHGYLGVDVGRAHQLLNTGLADFEVFVRHVEAYLGRP
jgi:uncharacterized protein YutE (UPF0331/DUF86 family)/predicted nucleotidyltransferase